METWSQVISKVVGDLEMISYSHCFKIKVTSGQKLCYKIKATFCEMSLKLRQSNWNVVINNVNVVVDELPSQITLYNCLKFDIWTQRCRRTLTRFYV